MTKKHSHLTHFHKTIIGPASLQNILILYRINITKAVDYIFLQIDAQGRCRTGRFMKYAPATWHRIKDKNTPSKVTWARSVLKYFSEEYRNNVRELIGELDLVPISVVPTKDNN